MHYGFCRLGILKTDRILECLKKVPPWDEVEMSSRSIGRGGNDTSVIGYQAKGSRAGSDAYSCLCTSTYRNDNGRWLLIQHQQTPG